MSLNKKQFNASRDRSPLVSIAAAPGSGKTTTLVEAIKYEIEMSDGMAGDIVAITFTNAAAAELKHRLNTPICYIGTLHGYCMRIMRQAIPGLTLLDEGEADKLLEATANELRYKGSKKALVQAKESFWNKTSIMGGTTEAERVILAYASKLTREKLLEYDMLLMRTSEFLKGWQKDKIKLFVDEYQDTSLLDARIYGLLPRERMLVVGDCDQSIYRFRGAEPQVFIDFHAIASQHTLTENYRSEPAIIQAANRLIAHSQVRIPMVMEASNLRSTGYYPPEVKLAENVPVMLEVIRNAAAYHGADESVAILTRTNAEVEQIKAYLQAMDVPINDTKHTPIPDLARVRTLVGLCLNPQSEVLIAIDKAQRKSTCSIELAFSPEHFAATKLSEVIQTIRNFHRPSEEIEAILQLAPELIPENEPYLLFDLIRDQKKADVKSTGISVLTCHSAKGLEFDHVIIANADSNSQETNDDDRRLFYVAMTRARHTLLAVGAKSRYVQWKGQQTHQLSPYVTEAGFVTE